MDDTNINKNNCDNILVELIKNQKKNVSPDKKLLYNDLKRLSKYLNTSIFGNECSLWTGYVTVIKNEEKNSYINFYFNGKKYALHRLLYLNYIGELVDSEYIKFNCVNKGKCCNINHFHKINKNDINDDLSNLDNKKDSEDKTDNNQKQKETHPNKPIIVDFKL
jgi:hypothetical protein